MKNESFTILQCKSSDITTSLNYRPKLYWVLISKQANTPNEDGKHGKPKPLNILTLLCEHSITRI